MDIYTHTVQQQKLDNYSIQPTTILSWVYYCTCHCLQFDKCIFTTIL